MEKLYWIAVAAIWVFIGWDVISKMGRRVRCLLMGHRITTTNTLLTDMVSTSCTFCRAGCGYVVTSVKNFEYMQTAYPRGVRVDFDLSGNPILTDLTPAASTAGDHDGTDAARKEE